MGNVILFLPFFDNSIFSIDIIQKNDLRTFIFLERQKVYLMEHVYKKCKPLKCLLLEIIERLKLHHRTTLKNSNKESK